MPSPAQPPGASTSERGEPPPRASLSATCGPARGGSLALALVVLAGTGWATLSGRGPELVATELVEAGAEGRGPGDLAMYRAMWSRLHRGEGYYEVVGSELRERGYPILPVFNWRTPLHLELVALFPSPEAARWLFGLLAIACLGLAVRWLRPGPGRWAEAAAVALLALGLVNGLIADLLLFSEIWAGALLALAGLTHANGWPKSAALMAIAALFFRELAAPACLAMGLVALGRRRWPEVGVWVAGALAWGAYFAAHAAAVHAHLEPGDGAAVKSWLGFVGPAFWVASLELHAAFTLLPDAARALVPPLVALGVLGWRDPAAAAIRATVGSLGLFVLVFGLPSSLYWSKLIFPLVGPLLVAGLVVLVRTFRAPRASRRDGRAGGSRSP